MLKRNVIANYIGQGWTAVIGLAFIPAYVKYMGVEAYGLVGLFAALTAWLTLLDMGLTPALGREMARYLGGTYKSAELHDLLRSVELIMLIAAIIIVIITSIGAPWIASSWLGPENIPIETVAQALAIMGQVAALRFLEGIYRSSIIGLQQHVLFNLINSTLATVRALGALVVLAYISPTVSAFFYWQLLMSVATVLVLAITTYHILPLNMFAGGFSMAALRGIWKFAGGMLGITFLAVMLTQTDKIILSKLLSLTDFGYYTLAVIVAGAIHIVIVPITQAWYPILCELYARNDEASIIDTYHKGVQWVTVVAGSVAIIIILFSERLIHLWSQDAELAKQIAPLLSVIAIGNYFNAMMWVPYQTQLAYGWTSLALRINLVAVVVLVPCMYYASSMYGGIGSAWVWVALNFGYVIVGIHFMHRKILKGEKWRWYREDFVRPMLFGVMAAGCIKLLSAGVEATMLNEVLLLIVASSVTVCVVMFAAVEVRFQVFRFLAASLKRRL
jgi:O-antigen/teichoic acid export membrane protein